MRFRTVPVMGAVGILALLGIFSALPPYVAFFVGALTIILFPGMIVVKLINPSSSEDHTLPERLAIWFVVGAGVLAVIAFAGLLAHTTLTPLAVALVAVYGVAVVLVALRKVPTGRPQHLEAGTAKHRGRIIPVIVIAIAVVAGVLTLHTPRDYDDWYYLAYIRDYTAGRPLASEDAIFDMGRPVPVRIWFGGAWWTVEAILSKVTGVDPVLCHQVFFPVLLLPFTVFSMFLLAKRIFRSEKAALLACCFQVLFYLSSAFPYKSAGWVFFCRIAQDKIVTSFLVVPIAVGFAMRFLRERTGTFAWKDYTYAIYWIAVIASGLIHGLGPLWCGLLILPPALVEVLRERCRRSAYRFVMLAMPLFFCGVILLLAQNLVVTDLESLDLAPGSISGAMSSFYLPGRAFGLPAETFHPTATIFGEGLRICNPLFITRYPLAMAGLLLTLLLIPRLKSDFGARFLMTITLIPLLLTFTPFGAAVTAKVISWKLLFRLTWFLPWGFTIGFLVSRLHLRPLLTWLIALAIALGLVGGNPKNYIKSLLEKRMLNRATPEAVEALKILGSQTSPQGVILSSERTNRLIAGFLPDAYPTRFRGEGRIELEDFKRLVGHRVLHPGLYHEISRNDIRYILLENSAPLAKTLAQNGSGFALIYENASFSLWKVPDIAPPADSQSGAQATQGTHRFP